MRGCAREDADVDRYIRLFADEGAAHGTGPQSPDDTGSAATFAVVASCASSERPILLIAFPLPTAVSAAAPPTSAGAWLTATPPWSWTPSPHGWHEQGLTHHTTGWLPGHPVGAAR